MGTMPGKTLTMPRSSWSHFLPSVHRLQVCNINKAVSHVVAVLSSSCLKWTVGFLLSSCLPSKCFVKSLVCMSTILGWLLPLTMLVVILQKLVISQCLQTTYDLEVPNSVLGWVIELSYRGRIRKWTFNWVERQWFGIISFLTSNTPYRFSSRENLNSLLF